MIFDIFCFTSVQTLPGAANLSKICVTNQVFTGRIKVCEIFLFSVLDVSNRSEKDLSCVRLCLYDFHLYTLRVSSI